MYKEQTMKRAVILMAAIVFLAAYSTSVAEIKTFVRDFTYQAGEADSKLTSRDNALIQVKRLLAEELARYLQSKTEVKNYQLTKDQIISYTALYGQTQIINEKWDGKEYWMQAKIEADPEEVAKHLDAVRKDRDQSKKLEELKRKTDELLKENEQLRKATKDDQISISLYERNIDDIKANGLLAEASILAKQNKHKEAIERLTSAIQLYSDHYSQAFTYATRGLSYLALRDYAQAIKDCTKAIGLNPEEDMAYRVRGQGYGYLSNYEQSIKDYDKAIALTPNNAYSYMLRASGYASLGNFKMAKTDYSQAIQLSPYNADAYHFRGHSLLLDGDKTGALNDFTKSCELGKNDACNDAHKLKKELPIAKEDTKVSGLNEKVEKADAARWFEKGMELSSRQDYRGAIAAFTKAIEINPEFAEAYHKRGLRYQRIGDRKQSLADLKKAAQLGHKNSQDFLRFQNVSW